MSYDATDSMCDMIEALEARQKELKESLQCGPSHSRAAQLEEVTKWLNYAKTSLHEVDPEAYSLEEPKKEVDDGATGFAPTSDASRVDLDDGQPPDPDEAPRFAASLIMGLVRDRGQTGFGPRSG